MEHFVADMGAPLQKTPCRPHMDFTVLNGCAAVNVTLDDAGSRPQPTAALVDGMERHYSGNRFAAM